MQQVYLKRMTKQDITRSVTVCTESVKSFWGVDPNMTNDYMSISVCHDDNPTYFPEGITIHKGYQGEKDWRICGNEWKKLYADDEPEEGDIMAVRKNSGGKFSLRIINKGTHEYKVLSQYFVGRDNYALITTDDSDNIKTDSTILHDKTKSLAFRPYITAIKSKPFLLLAGISGTGKSRIVRELARACWDKDSEEYKAQKPRNFEMVQVKPNWHDSSELIGYVSRVSGEPVYVAGAFLKFIARAWAEPDIPYFLCLDEMNLAPVEQYFAEYLSVIESRKNEDNIVVTDSILPAAKMKGPGGAMILQIWYSRLVEELLSGCPKTKEQDLRNQFINEGISIPQNLIVIGTVNMDETTFSFSRKVLDRAMTIEMNEVDLNGGLEESHENIGKLGAKELIGTAVEGKDVYSDYKDVCDTAIAYLQKINDVLEGTPFKIAYRTRNEVLLYVVNNLPYNQIEGEDESVYKDEFVIARALDEITSMKILSRIEGDESKVSKDLLEKLRQTIKEGLETVFDELFEEDEDGVYTSVSLTKLDEMTARLDSGYTSFWS